MQKIICKVFFCLVILSFVLAPVFADPRRGSAGVPIRGGTSVPELDVQDGNITNVGNIALDSISSDAGTSINVTLGADAGDDFIIDTTGFVYEGDTDRVGIGTTAPGVLLDLNDTTAASVNGQDVLRLRGIISTGAIGSGAVISFTNPLGDELGNIRSYLEDGSSAGLHFGTFDSSTQQESRMVIASTGNVGIGTTSPSALLNLKGNLSLALTGTVAATNLSTAVVGTGTLFTTELAVGDSIKIGEVFTVSVITDALNLTLDSAYQGATASGLTAYRDPTLFAIDNGDAVNKLTITKSGNVGIGTTGPGSILEIKATTPVLTVNGTSGATFKGLSFKTNGSETAIIKTESTVGELRIQTGMSDAWGGFQTFHTNNLERVRITSSGNVGIGTATPLEKLHVYGGQGDTETTDGVIAINKKSSTGNVLTGKIRYESDGTSHGNMLFQVKTTASGAENDAYYTNALAIDGQNGNVGIGTTSPTSLLTVAGPISTQAPATKTAAYSMIATDSSLIFNGTASSILTLQAASSYTGRILYVKTIAAFTVDSASANVVPLGSSTAGTAILAATAGKWAMLQSDGTNWVIMAGN